MQSKQIMISRKRLIKSTLKHSTEVLLVIDENETRGGTIK